MQTTDFRTRDPRRRFGRWLGRLLLRICGWRVEPFPDIGKAVAVGGPHTSNWDAVLGFAAAASLDLQTVFLVKESAFKWWPLSSLLRRLGAIPIDRTHTGGAVEQAVELFQHRERLVMVVTPEGTRTNAPRWKTGFHHIARLAGVPIVLAVANYATKELTFPLVIEPGEDMEADMRKMIECFADTTPRHPDKLSAPIKAMRKEKRKQTR